MTAALTDISTHFSFGENWQDFLRHVDEGAVERAIDGLTNALQGRPIEGKTFLDIGCGSGLSSLAAIRLGASRVVAIDIDAKSVEATRLLMSREAPDANIDVRELSVFDADPILLGTFDIVYSWGVLHHTGDMWRAVARASEFVAPKGILSIALYRKTPLCWAWALEKRWYANATDVGQRTAQRLYKAGFFVANIAIGRNPLKIRERAKGRGMNYDNDVHDWLGGYPYESASFTEVCDHIPTGFRMHPPKRHRWLKIGLFGTGCAEYLFERFSYDFPVTQRTVQRK